MVPLVQDQVEVPREGLPALAALEGLLAAVGLQVAPQVGEVLEGLPALLTLEALLRGVRLLVTDELRAVPEGSCTFVARVGFIPARDLLRHDEAGGPEEGFSALSTFKRVSLSRKLWVLKKRFDAVKGLSKLIIFIEVFSDLRWLLSIEENGKTRGFTSVTGIAQTFTGLVYLCHCYPEFLQEDTLPQRAVIFITFMGLLRKRFFF